MDTVIIGGKWKQLAGKLQEGYGWSKERAEQKVRDLSGHL
ncbi:hypothetical protein [Pseudomonas cavernae]|nr:hypothetical protein [Pseudomonas cavernae]